MKNSRLVYLAPVAAAVALLILSLMAYAGFLTSSWGTLLVCAPPILATIGIVSAIAGAVILFNKEENETPEEAFDAVALLDRLCARIGDLVHRAAIRLHVYGLGR